MKVSVGGLEFSTGSWPGFWQDVQNGLWERQSFSILKKFLRSDKSFIDLGAWIGPLSLFGCQLAHHCYAVEPDPVALRHLNANIALNPSLISRITVIDEAVIDRAGEVVLGWENPPGLGSSMTSVYQSVCGRDRSLQEKCTVKATTLTELVSRFGINDCSFSKIDVEGSEVPILASSASWIATAKPSILLSIHHFFFDDPKAKIAMISGVLSCYKRCYDMRGNKVENVGEYMLQCLRSDTTTGGRTSYSILLTDGEWLQ